VNDTRPDKRERLPKGVKGARPSPLYPYTENRDAMRRKLFGLGVTAVAVVAIFGIGSGAVTNADGGVTLPETRAGDVITNGAVNPQVVNLNGKIQLTANGQITKTLVNPNGGCGVGNLKVYYTNWNGSGSYNVIEKWSWNAPGTCGGFNPLLSRFTDHDGTQSIWYTHDDGETLIRTRDSVGTATSRVEMRQDCGSYNRTHVIVVAPWGTDQVYSAC
jgi:hypothetical protein